MSKRVGWRPVNEALIEARQTFEKIKNPIDRARMRGQWDMIVYYWESGAVSNALTISEVRRLGDKARETVGDEKVAAHEGW